MSVREISQRVAIEYHDAMNGEGLPEAIKRAIREAAAPLVEALGRTVGRNVQDELSRKAVLAEWRSKP